MLNNLKDFLRNRKQKVVLNGPFSSWEDVEAGVPQGSVLGPLLFLIYINDFSSDLTPYPKLFADGTFIFAEVKDITVTANEMNEDLKSKRLGISVEKELQSRR